MTLRPALLGVVLVAALVAVPAVVLAGSGREAPGAAQSPPVDAAASALAERASALVSITPDQLGFRVQVAPPREGVRAQANLERRTITLFVDPADAAHRVAHDLAHELGHAFDGARLTPAQRAEWLRRRGVDNAPWSPGPTVSDYGSGAGDFAEVFARCFAASPEFRSRLAPAPADACALLPAAAREMAQGRIR